MCASYGLGSGGGTTLPNDLPPLSEQASKTLLEEWMRSRSGSAKITGRRALNLNPIIRADAGGERSLELAWWWLWLDGSGPAKFSAFNSRDDKLLRSWKRQFQHRALLPATWYVEKKGRFQLPGGEVFGIAAVTSTVTQEDGTELVTYSMVTRDAPEDSEAAEYWPRMPLVLPRDQHDTWLDPERAGDETLVAEVQHASDEISRALTTGAPLVSVDSTLF
ncbi:SOS response-associated peptidase family protein [Leucobacter sp. CSA1]|uniref:SOS response-associated peptidase family protein n=1 Tax=Leucobacter chromiisoli TaxID=2796471 RepID=A0A934Q5H7_9MICO|nr:SOS response-associated peptidase family protein [Leucobacter chromiisoli]MBK0417421.1 SOS response-associated peptidase family protein [Leucobacter chromiisoli]